MPKTDPPAENGPPATEEVCRVWQLDRNLWTVKRPAGGPPLTDEQRAEWGEKLVRATGVHAGADWSGAVYLPPGWTLDVVGW